MKTSEPTVLDVGVITLFPSMFDALDYGVCGRALQSGQLDIQYWDPRDYSTDKHRRVDDRPYGGGPGMVMAVQPLKAAIQQAKLSMGKVTTVYLSPQGKVIDQALINRFVDSKQRLLLIAGRYEGVDERIVNSEVDEEWSVGDVVLSGGELAAMLVIDAMARMMPGVLGNEESAKQDSFMQGLLDHPHYTRPEVIDGQAVPRVLLSGDHEKIRHWRLKQALGRSWLRRPDLLRRRELSLLEQQLLEEFIDEYKLGVKDG